MHKIGVIFRSQADLEHHEDQTRGDTVSKLSYIAPHCMSAFLLSSSKGRKRTGDLSESKGAEFKGAPSLRSLKEQRHSKSQTGKRQLDGSAEVTLSF